MLVPTPAAALDLALLEDLPLGLWVARAPDGQVVLANRAFNRIMGMDAVADAVIGDTPAVYGIVDRQGRPYPVEKLPFSRAIATGQIAIVDDLVIARPDGKRVCVRAVATPIRSTEGGISHVAVTFMDTSVEVEATEGRRLAEQRLAFAVQNAPIVVWMTDPAGTITLSEGAALEALGLQPGQVVGMSIYDLYRDHPDIKDNHRKALAGQPVSYTGAVGALHWSAHLAPVRAEDGTLTGVIGVATDITESRLLEQRVVAADRVHAIGTLAASVAHEINNPLTYILANVDIVSSELDDAARALAEDAPDAAATAIATMRSAIELLGPVRTGAERVRRITQDLRTFTRRDEDSGATCDVTGAVRRALELVGKDAQAHARLVVDVPTSPILAVGNDLRLSQVFVNLLVNAWQALPEANPRRHEISVRVRTEASFVVVEIADSGPGVAGPDRGRVFDPFFTTKPVGTGTGLGLFVCRNIVNAAGGEITVDDRPGGGALFRVRLVIAERVARRASPVPNAHAVPANARVLIVDDNELVADALARTLRACSIETHVEHDGRQVLSRLLAGERFDLLYVDVMMNVMTGLELVEQIAAKVPHVLESVVLMTGGAFTPEAREFVQSQRREVVQKPFSIAADARARLATRARS